MGGLENVLNLAENRFFVWIKTMVKDFLWEQKCFVEWKLGHLCYMKQCNMICTLGHGLILLLGGRVSTTPTDWLFGADATLYMLEIKTRLHLNRFLIGFSSTVQLLVHAQTWCREAFGTPDICSMGKAGISTVDFPFQWRPWRIPAGSDPELLGSALLVSWWWWDL